MVKRISLREIASSEEMSSRSVVAVAVAALAKQMGNPKTP